LQAREAGVVAISHSGVTMARFWNFEIQLWQIVNFLAGGISTAAIEAPGKPEIQQ
jgi:hypothetical protein